MSPLVLRIMQTISRSCLSSPRLRPSSTSRSVSRSPSETRILSAGGNFRSWLKRVGSRASSSSGSCKSTGLSKSGRRFRGPAPFFEAPAHPRHQPAHAQQLVHELRKRLAAVLVAAREVADDPFVEVDLELVAFVHGFCRLRRLEDGIAHVDGVAEEDARVRVGDHERYAGAADRHWRDLA